jgi:hypothetical protein
MKKQGFRFSGVLKQALVFCGKTKGGRSLLLVKLILK